MNTIQNNFVSLNMVEGTSARALRTSGHLRLAYDCRVGVVRAEVSKKQAAPSNAPLVIVCVVLAITLALSLWGESMARTSRVSEALDSAVITAVRVTQGDTLWGIAETHPLEGMNTQELVSWIRTNNGLASSALRPGQVLHVPTPR